MEIEFDTAKNAQNIEKHGMSFERVNKLDWSDAVTLEDDRCDYGESRKISYVMLAKRLYIFLDSA